MLASRILLVNREKVLPGEKRNIRKCQKMGRTCTGAARAQLGCAIRREWEMRMEQTCRSLNARLRVLGLIWKTISAQ